jgi:serine/threonine protein kinase
LVPNAHPDDLAFLSLLFQLDPNRRLSAAESLQHPYFQQSPLPTESTTSYFLDVLLGSAISAEIPRATDCYLNASGTGKSRAPQKERLISSVEEFADIASMAVKSRFK